MVCYANASIIDFSLHIPIPLIDLVLLKAKTLLQLYNLGLGPAGILLELKHQDLILLLILAQSFLCFFSTLVLVSDYNVRDLSGLDLPMLGAFRRILRSTLKGISVVIALLQSLNKVFGSGRRLGHA